MDRRKLFKNGLALAGGSVLTSVVKAQDKQQSQDSQIKSTATSFGRRKLGTLEVSSLGLAYRTCPVPTKPQYQQGPK